MRYARPPQESTFDVAPKGAIQEVYGGGWPAVGGSQLSWYAMDIVVSFIALAVSLVSAVAAVGAWIANRQSAREAKTVAAIERERRHSELTPEFDLSYEPGVGDWITLRMALNGPAALARLDEIVLLVRDDNPDRVELAKRVPSVGNGPTPEEIADQVWGPYQFRYGADGADRNGRSIAPFALPVGESRVFVLDRTVAPRWTGPTGYESWRQQYDGTPLRLTLQCRRGDAWWELKLEVDLPPSVSETIH
jgi:hypothetical protein